MEEITHKLFIFHGLSDSETLGVVSPPRFCQAAHDHHDRHRQLSPRHEVLRMLLPHQNALPEQQEMHASRQANRP
jgi:hypothetical protein